MGERPGRPPSCTCGGCAKCKHAAYMREWYKRHPGYAARAQQKRRQLHPEAIRESDRLKMQRRRKFGTPEQKMKIAARHKALLAILDGRLPRQPCEVCGITENVHAHHDDYSEPLEVRWLCRPHHDEHHRQLDQQEAA